MKTAGIIQIAALASMFLFACGSKSEYNDMAMAEPSDKEVLITEEAGNFTAADSTGLTGGSAASAPISAPAHYRTSDKIIRTANISFMVKDYAKSRTEIEKTVRSMRAYIADENEQNNSHSISNTMTIRVVNDEFYPLVERLTSVASEVTAKTIDSKDVTAQFVDIQARLKTKKEVEQRYISLLNKATKISEILEIEEKMRAIREEIEAKEGELKYLSDQVAYSTIVLHFYETHEFQPSGQPGFFNRLASAFASGWKGLLGFMIGVVHAWPLWLILGFAAYMTVRLIKRAKRSSDNSQSTNNQ